MTKNKKLIFFLIFHQNVIMYGKQIKNHYLSGLLRVV